MPIDSMDDILGEAGRCEKTLCLNHAGKVRTAAEGRLSRNVCKGCYTRNVVTGLKRYVRDFLNVGISKADLKPVLQETLIKLMTGTNLNNLHVIRLMDYYGFNG